MYSSERNFADPTGFHPERWLGDEKFANDALELLKPFHYGLRDCIGKK